MLPDHSVLLPMDYLFKKFTIQESAEIIRLYKKRDCLFYFHPESKLSALNLQY